MGEGFLFADQPALHWPLALYAILAAVVTLWQAYRGFRLRALARQREDDLGRHVSEREKVVLFCLADAFFYAVCTGVGFASLWLAWSFVDVAASAAVSVGFAAVWVFLLLLGVVGVTGRLPYLIQLGKILPGRS